MAGVKEGFLSGETVSSDFERQSQFNSNEDCLPDTEKESRPSLAQKLFNEAVDKFVSAIKWSDFKSHYSIVYKEDKKWLRLLYLQFTEDLKTRVAEEVNETILNDNFMSNLSKLDRIVANNSQNADLKSKAWRPSRKPDKDLKPARVEVKLEAKARLEELLKNLIRDNASLRQNNKDDEHMINQLEHQLKIKLTQLNEVEKACEELPFSVISKFSTRVYEKTNL